MILPPSGHRIDFPDRFGVDGFDPFVLRVRPGFFVPTSFLQHLERNGPGQRFYDANLIEATLRNPTVILEGLRRDNYANGLCYCSVPTTRQDVMGSPGRPPAGMVFAVYLNANGNDEWVVFDFDWRLVSPSAQGIPGNWEQDFERILWPRR